MLVEFLGIVVFSYIMGSINSSMGTDATPQTILDERIEDVECWLRKLEKNRSKNFSKILYDSIRSYTKNAYYYDFY